MTGGEKEWLPGSSERRRSNSGHRGQERPWFYWALPRSSRETATTRGICTLARQQRLSGGGEGDAIRGEEAFSPVAPVLMPMRPRS